jgi:FHS family L-fucose permease-like MFS transporter
MLENNEMRKSKSNPVLYLYLVYFIYFFCGMAQCFESVFPNEFIEYFHLTNTQWAYTSLAKNSAFLLLSIPVGFIASKIGYRRCLTIAMLLYAAGTFFIIPALHHGWYWLILTAFFIVGAGFNFQLVVGNPLLSLLGKPEGSASRLNLGNALGAVAWIIAPLLITVLVPVSITRASDKIPYMIGIFTAIAVILVVTVAATFFVRDISQSQGQKDKSTANNEPAVPLWKNLKVLFGFVAIFLVLGTEGGVFSFYQVYLKSMTATLTDLQKSTFTFYTGIQLTQNQLLFTIFFTLYAVGRLLGSVIQRKVKPVFTVAGALIASLIILVLVVFVTKGITGIVLLTGLGLFISILFPTLYAMAIEGLGNDTAKASGILTMGFLGGTVIPLVQGKLADLFSVGFSFITAIVAYAVVILYVLYYLRNPSKKSNYLR